MNSFLPRTTFGLAALISIVLCGLILATGYIAQDAAHEEIERQLRQRIANETALLLKEYRTGGTSALVAAMDKRTAPHAASGMAYLLVDSSGARIAGELAARVPDPGWKEFLSVQDEVRPHVAESLTTALPDGARLLVAADRTPVEQIDATITRITTVTSVTMLACSLGGAWLLGLTVRRRIDEINRVAVDISEGQRDRRMPRDARSGEFDRLAATLNRMLDRNAELVTNLQQLSSDIAHDLRTPLGRQQQLLELALTECKDIAGYRHAIEQARLAGEDTLQLFSAMLKISEIESRSIRTSFGPVDLSELTERVVDAFRPDAEAGSRALEARPNASVTVEGNRQLLSQLLVNLIENAMRHTPAGARIYVDVRRVQERVELCVSDNGPGIEPGERSRVLERFVRLERSRSTPGHGLGLSLVKAIADAHDADLRLDDAQPGLRVIVSFKH